MVKAIIYCLCILMILSNLLTDKCKAAQPLVPALYVFGDSLFDNGNNNYLRTMARANYFPYGVNFPGNVSTGRFTNGKNSADFVAEYLGLPYPPPYASILTPDSYTGYNYASGSCGILPETGQNFGKCLIMDEQIQMFEKTVKQQLASKFDYNQLSQHLAKSIFMVSVGNNDYILNYFGFLQTQNNSTSQQFANLLIETLSRQLQKLYSLGMRKVVVFELGPIGCLPTIAKGSMTIAGTPKLNGTCDAEKLLIVSLFNNQLQPLLANLTSKLHGSHFTYGRIYPLTYDTITNPTKYGLKDSTNPCCKTWGNGTLTCIPELTPCSNPDKHFFWDGYHPNSVMLSVVASRCINGSDICIPMNIEQLVKA